MNKVRRICVTRYPQCEVDMANNHAAALLQGQNLSAKRGRSLGWNPEP